MLDESNKGSFDDASLVQSHCATFTGTEELIISDLLGTETILSNGGTATGTVSAGKVSFTAGTCWELKLSNGAIYPCSQGFEAYLYNTGTGANALVTGAVLNDFWGSTQDVYHYNIREGFDLYTDGSGNEIKVPVGKTCETAGYTLESENPAGEWHNGAETGIKPPDSLSDILNNIPFTSFTKNAELNWINGEIDEFDAFTSGTSTITEASNGTKINSPDGDSCYIQHFNDFEPTEYEYYLEIESITGTLKLGIGSQETSFTSTGIKTGTITTTSAANGVYLSRSGVCDAVVSKLYFWKAGTVPPLFYKEFQENFNDAGLAFSNIEDKEKRMLLVYSEEQTDAELNRIYKCIDKAPDFSNLTLDGDNLTLDGDNLVIGD